METQQIPPESLLLQSMADAMLCVSHEGLVVAWNSGAERVFGYSKEEILGQPFARLVPSTQSQLEAEVAHRTRQGETIDRFDAERITRSGQKIQVSVSAAPIYDDSGRYLGSVRVVRDVSVLRRRDAELNRLHEAAQKLSATLDPRRLCSAFRELVAESIPCDGMVVSTFDEELAEIRCTYLWTGKLEMDPLSLPALKYEPETGGMQTEVIRTGRSRIFDVGERVSNTSGKFIEVNPEGERRDLKGPEAKPPTPKSALMSPITLEGRVLGVVQVMSHEEDAYGPSELKAFEALIAPLAVAFQNAELYNASQRELAERKAAEAALRESEERYRALAAELEERVTQRTAALERAVDELTGFSYSISHDMRAPIRAIIASSRILLDDFADELSSEAVAVLKRQVAASQKLGALVDDLLQYARLGHSDPVRDCFDISAIATSVAERLSKPDWPCEGADFEIESGLSAHGDESMIEILLTILMENAGKYRRKGATPRIQFGREGGVYFVKDDGIGFDMNFVGKLFQPFQRLHRDEDYPGTGIGLANAKRIVERHGGRIWAESQGVGQGTILRFTLGREEC